MLLKYNDAFVCNNKNLYDVLKKKKKNYYYIVHIIFFEFEGRVALELNYKN